MGWDSGMLDGTTTRTKGSHSFNILFFPLKDRAFLGWLIHCSILLGHIPTRRRKGILFYM